MDTEYISLGGNCAVAYQLHKNRLRTTSYPFDWSRTTIKQLCSALEDNLDKYVSTLKISNFSNNHPYIKLKGPNLELDDKGTFKCSNKYGITFSHELVKQNEFITLKEILERRKNRLLNISKCEKSNITFIRIENKIISPSSYIQTLYKIIIKLFEMVNYSSRFKIEFVIVLHNKNNDINEYVFNNHELKKLLKENDIKINFIYYDKFTPDWQMNHLNWQEIFSLN